MRIRTKLSLTAAAIVVALSMILEISSLLVFSGKIHGLNKALFDEKVDRLVSIAYEQDELFFEGVQRDVKDGQQRVITKLDILYRNQKDPVTYPFVIDTQGKIISHPAESRWRKAFRKKWEKGDRIFDERQMASIVEKKKGEFKFKDPEEPERWCVYRVYEPWGWVFCMTTTTAYLNQATVSFIRIAILISFFATLLSFLGVFVISEHFSRPILDTINYLQEIARQGGGAKRLPVSEKATDEVAQLARAVNRMAEDLDKTTVSRDILVREMSSRKAVEEKLRQSEKMGAVGQLAGGIAHDLNNGLTPVMGYLDMLLIDEGLSPATKSMIAEAKQSTQRCSEVVQKLMNFSRPTPQARTHLEIGRLLTELKKMLRPVFPATITVEIEFPPDIGTCYANESDIMTVLMNLAINSRDAMSKEGGKFTIKASGVGDRIFLCVSDTGSGIPPELLPHIFEPFFTTKAKGSGTGLGLAMVYNIIKEHGGTIEVSSQPGKGTFFYVYLPRHLRAGKSESPAVLGKQSEPEKSGIPKGQGNVLFVDDEAAVRNMGKVFLERLGYAPYLAVDGEDALRIFRQHHAEIAAIVLDMTMPKLSGLETLRRLLAIDPRAKIAVASGYTAEGTPQELLDAGAKLFLQKPYTLGPLAQALQKLTVQNP